MADNQSGGRYLGGGDAILVRVGERRRSDVALFLRPWGVFYLLFFFILSLNVLYK